MKVNKTQLGLVHILHLGDDDLSHLDVLLTNEEARDLLEKLKPVIEISPYTKQLEEA